MQSSVARPLHTLLDILEVRHDALPSCDDLFRYPPVFDGFSPKQIMIMLNIKFLVDGVEANVSVETTAVVPAELAFQCLNSVPYFFRL